MAKLLNLDPALDLPKAFEQIAAEQAAQTQGVQQFGAAQDAGIQKNYQQLTGDLQQGVKTTQSIYGNAASNVQGAYDRAGLGGQAAASQNQSAIGEFASRLGMDPRALSDVQGRLAAQAQTFDLRNKQSSTQRQGNLQQLGAGMSAVAQLGVQAAQQAEAQGRADLSRKIQALLQGVQTSAAQARSGFTAQKLNQTAKAVADAQKEMLTIQRQLVNDQRVAQREAASEARAAARASSAGPSWEDKFALTNAEYDRRQSNKPGAAPNPFDQIMEEIKNDPRFAQGTHSLDAILAAAGGMSQKDLQSQFKTPGGKKLNWSLINSEAARLKLVK
jgi:uncharacterized metal-binding protein